MTNATKKAVLQAAVKFCVLDDQKLQAAEDLIGDVLDYGNDVSGDALQSLADALDNIRKARGHIDKGEDVAAHDAVLTAWMLIRIHLDWSK